MDLKTEAGLLNIFPKGIVLDDEQQQRLAARHAIETLLSATANMLGQEKPLFVCVTKETDGCKKAVFLIMPWRAEKFGLTSHRIEVDFPTNVKTTPKFPHPEQPWWKTHSKIATEIASYLEKKGLNFQPFNNSSPKNP